MAHETIDPGRKDNNFHVTRYFQNSIPSITNIVPNSVLEELKQIQKTFLWRNIWARIKHDTLCNNFTEGGLKSVDIKHKISQLKCSWIQ